MSQASATASLGDLFCQAVLAAPARVALDAAGRQWTYGELGRVVAAAAARLWPVLGTPPGRLAIVADNHPAYIVAFFAAQLCGGTTVEIGRLESLDTLHHLIERTGARAVLTDRDDLVDRLPGLFVERPDAFLEEAERSARSGDGHLTAAPAAPADDATIVFTSGTTGLPKGVVLSHANLLFVTEAVCRYLALGPRDRYGLVLPLSHTYGKSNLLTSVAAGATIVLLDGFRDPTAFVRELAARRCTVLSVVPFHLNVLARRRLLSMSAVPELRAVTTSGGSLSWDVVDALAAAHAGIRLFPMYGLTESTTRVTYLPPELVHVKVGSVGRPLPGVSLEIRHDDGTPLPSGRTGHIVVRGPNLMQRYFDEPELTRTTLVDGWLRTGDLGRLDEDGFLFIEGRAKEIIKVAGERISPAEIEAVLATHPGVADAAAAGAPDPLLGEVVWAYVVPRAERPDAADLSAFCARRLSHHKLPRRFVFVDALPRTATGKIRRHLLPRG